LKHVISCVRPIFETIFMLAASVASLGVIAFAIWTWIDERGSASIIAADSERLALSAVRQTLDGAPVLGRADATVAIIEYADFECPACAAFSREVRPQIERGYVDTGKILTVFKHLPLPMHEHARDAALGAVCAGNQGQFWQMRTLLFQQARLEPGSGRILASRIGLDMTAFETCIVGQQAVTVLTKDEDEARSIRLRGTPSFLIGRVFPDRTVKVSYVLEGAKPFATFKAILDELLDERAQWFRPKLGHGRSEHQ
jgi:protein-disulfide isomerase